MTVNLILTVNDVPIKTDYFVAGFIDHTVSGMIEALEGTGKIKNLNLMIEDDTVDNKFERSSCSHQCFYQ